MAQNTRYHRVPEENSPSIDAIFDDDERLLDPLDNEFAPRKRDNGWKFTWHPLVFTRLAVVFLLTLGLIFLLVSQQRISIAAIVFTCLGLARNLLVLFYYVIGHFVRIEIVRISTPTRPGFSKLKHCLIQIAIDLHIALGLLISASIAFRGDEHYWDRRVLQVPGCISILIAIFFQAISAIDGGSPRRLVLHSVLTFDTNKDGDHEAQLPREYGNASAAMNNASETSMILCLPEAAVNSDLHASAPQQ